MNQVGKIVKQKREASGLSQNQLAKKAGISQASLNALESKTNNPSVETCFLLAAALECPVSELLGENTSDSVFLTSLQRELLNVFSQLNDTGKDFLMAQAQWALSQPAFRQVDSVSIAV